MQFFPAFHSRSLIKISAHQPNQPSQASNSARHSYSYYTLLISHLIINGIQNRARSTSRCHPDPNRPSIAVISESGLTLQCRSRIFSRLFENSCPLAPSSVPFPNSGSISTSICTVYEGWSDRTKRRIQSRADRESGRESSLILDKTPLKK